MKTSKPLVSIITPGWNGQNFVHRLLESILAQTYDNIEYIYVDDGSTDGTKYVVLNYKERFEQKGIPLLYVYKENGGLCSAIQEGLKYVKGKYLCWPEYDDILLPTAIEERVNYLESHPDCAVVTCDAWITPENDLEHPTGVLSFNNPNRFDRNHFVQLLTGNSIFTAACHMVRMDVFDETHPNREIFHSQYGAVWQMLLPLMYKHNRGFIDKPLVKWVVRGKSISHERYSEEKRLEIDKEFLNISLNVINTIDMPKDDRILYTLIAKKCAALSIMENGYSYHSKSMFYQGYNDFVVLGLHVTKDIRFRKLQFDLPCLYYMVCFYNSIKYGLFSVFKVIYHRIY